MKLEMKTRHPNHARAFDGVSSGELQDVIRAIAQHGYSYGEIVNAAGNDAGMQANALIDNRGDAWQADTLSEIADRCFIAAKAIRPIEYLAADESRALNKCRTIDEIRMRKETLR